MTKQQMTENIKEMNLIQDDTEHSNKVEAFINNLDNFESQLFSIAFYLKTVGARVGRKGNILDNWFTKHETEVKTINFNELLKEVNSFL